MHKVWRWLRERRRHALRKWRSSIGGLPPRRSSRGNEEETIPTIMSASTSRLSDYETYFDDYEDSLVGVPASLTKRRRSRLSRSAAVDVSPEEEGLVSKVDIYASYPGGAAASPRHSPRFSPRNSPRVSPRSSPPQRRSLPTPPDTPPRRLPETILSSPLRPRSKTLQKIRFNIPQVQVALDDEEPRRVDFDEALDEALDVVDNMMRPPSPAHIRKSSAPPTNGAYSQERSYTVDLMRSSVCSEMSDVAPAGFVPTERRTSTGGDARRKLSIAQQRRQSTLVSSMSGRRTSTTLIPLTMPQIHLVRSLWKQVYTTKGPTEIGTRIFHGLCFKQPGLRRVPVPPQFNNYDSFIKAHCKALADLVDQVVENLDNLDQMSEELQCIGRTHARLLRGEINGKLWNTVAETFIDCTLEWGDKRCRSETVRKAWALIVAFMIEKIKLGHHEQRKLMLSTRSSMPTIENLPPLASMKL